MEKKLDIFNQNGEKTGESETYNNVHLYGLLHRTVHVWFVNSKKEFLLQKRANSEHAYSNCWDISAAGHINSGETSLQAAIRETKEELGINLPDSVFKFLTTIKRPIVNHSNIFIDNEFNDIYLVHCDFAISEFKLQIGEVEKVRWINKKEFKKWIKGEGETLVSHMEEYQKLFEYN